MTSASHPRPLCLLEYRPEMVDVHDHLWTRDGDNWVAERLSQNGLTLTRMDTTAGTITIMAEKR